MAFGYTCAECGGTFDSDRPEGEAEAEKDALFLDVDLDDCAIVCDTCWKSMGFGQ